MARALFYTAPREIELHEVPSQPLTPVCDARVRTLWSGISRGTERLVFEGRIPTSEYERMRAPFQEGDFPYPVKYGYSAVVEVEEGPPELLGKPYFALFPHQTEFEISSSALIPLPENLPPKRAILAANMETALNAIWDSNATLVDALCIVGGGLVGGLLAGLLSQLPGADVTLVDVNRDREALADHMNVSFCVPEDSPQDCDVVFHTSATESGAATAFACAGVESRIVELSWFGDKVPALPLGGAFHSKRLTYQSSQVGMIPATRRARWSYTRRMTKALDLLCDPRYDALITGEVAFDDLLTKLPDILAPNAPGLATAVKY